MIVKYNLYQASFFFILFSVFSACASPSENQKNSINNNREQNDTFEISKDSVSIVSEALSDNFNVVLFDSTNGWLQRIFVVIDSNNIELLGQAVCFLQRLYQLDERVSISFYSEEKYANYHDILFFRENKTLSMSEYENWLNHYYLAEYDYNSNTIVQFPGRGGKREEIHLLPCE